jgi:hypothetical protein
MAYTLFKLNRHKTKKISYFVMSKDWWSFTPWNHEGLNQSYIDYKESFSKSRNVFFTYRYIGPFAIMTGKWLE